MAGAFSSDPGVARKSHAPPSRTTDALSALTSVLNSSAPSDSHTRIVPFSMTSAGDASTS